MTKDETRRATIGKHFPCFVHLPLTAGMYNHLLDKFGRPAPWVRCGRDVADIRVLHPDSKWAFYSDDYVDGCYIFFKEAAHAVEFKLRFG